MHVNDTAATMFGKKTQRSFKDLSTFSIHIPAMLYQLTTPETSVAEQI